MDTISKRTKHGGLVLFLTALILLYVSSRSSLATAQDVLTWHNDNARTGQNLEERTLTLRNVNPKKFGKLFTISIDGKVDAEPLYTARRDIPHEGFRNVLFVATEHDSLYALDADTGKQFWHVRLLKPGETPSDNVHCGQIVPEIVITSTPVIDLHRGPHGTIYVVTMSKDSQGRYFQRDLLCALSSNNSLQLRPSISANAKGWTEALLQQPTRFNLPAFSSTHSAGCAVQRIVNMINCNRSITGRQTISKTARAMRPVAKGGGPSHSA